MERCPSPLLTRGMDRGGVWGREGKGREEGKGRCGREGKRWRPRTTGDEPNNPLNNAQQIPRGDVFCAFSFSSFLSFFLSFFLSLLFFFTHHSLHLSFFSRFARHVCSDVSPLAKIETLNCVISSRLKWPFPPVSIG